MGQEASSLVASHPLLALQTLRETPQMIPEDFSLDLHGRHTVILTACLCCPVAKTCRLFLLEKSINQTKNR